MKKNLTLFILFTLIFLRAHSQSDSTEKKNNLVSAGIYIPLGELSKTHFLGLGATYTWSKHYFTGLKKVSKNPALALQAGFEHYFGTKESNGFRFFGLSDAHLMAGIIKQTGLHTQLGLSGGAVCRIYKSNTDFAPVVNLYGIYFINESFGITPSLQYAKHANENAQWALGISAVYNF